MVPKHGLYRKGGGEGKEKKMFLRRSTVQFRPKVSQHFCRSLWLLFDLQDMNHSEEPQEIPVGSEWLMLERFILLQRKGGLG